MTLKHRWKIESIEITVDQLLSKAIGFLHGYIKEENSDILNAIVFELQAKIQIEVKFSQPTLSARGKVYYLLEIVKSHEHIVPGSKNSLLDVLININETYLSVAEAIRKDIKQTYEDRVRIYCDCKESQSPSLARRLPQDITIASLPKSTSQGSIVEVRLQQAAASQEEILHSPAAPAFALAASQSHRESGTESNQSLIRPNSTADNKSQASVEEKHFLSFRRFNLSLPQFQHRFHLCENKGENRIVKYTIMGIIFAATLLLAGIKIVNSASDNTSPVPDTSQTIESLNGSSSLPLVILTTEDSVIQQPGIGNLDAKAAGHTILEETTETQNVFTSTETVTTTSTPPLKRRRHTVVRVASSSELESKMILLQNLPSVWVELSLKNLLDWESEFVIPFAEKIHGLILRGPLYADFLLQILRQTHNLKILHLNNVGNDLCATNEGQLMLQRSIKKFSLRFLRILILENFETCSEVYNAIVAKLEMNNLEGLRIQSGNINTKNYLYIHGLLQRTNSSLTHLSFHLTKFVLDDSKLLFDSRSTQLTKLEDIHVDFIPNERTNDSTVIFLGSTFSEFAPNLMVLTSDRGSLPWNQVRHVLRCKKLRKMKLAIEILPNRSYFNTSFLRQHSNLREVRLGLHHSKCDANTRNNQFIRLEGIELLPLTIEKLEFLSNCELRPVMSMVPSQNKRKAFYHIVNTLYAVKFEILSRASKRKGL